MTEFELLRSDAAAKDLFLRKHIGSLTVDLHTRIIECHLCANIFLEEDEGETSSADMTSVHHLDGSKPLEGSANLSLVGIMWNTVDIDSVSHWGKRDDGLDN